MQAAAWVQAVAGVFTFGAACVAAWIAGRVPGWSEQIRTTNRISEQAADLKRVVLISLLKGRSALLHQDTLAAINLIDVAFIDAHAVRDARRNFIAAAGAEPFSADRLLERFHGIIIAVVREMGLSESITAADIQGGYYPRALGKMDEAALIDAEDKLAKRAAIISKPDKARGI